MYAGLNRLILDTDASVLLVTGPGHGAPANLANLWIDGCLEDVKPEMSRDREGLSEARAPVLLAGRLPQPHRPDRARHDPRGRRARLRAGDRVRRRAGQPRADRRLHRRRRRGRDRPDGGRVALQQVPRPRDLRRGAADAAPQRLQDRQPDDLQLDDRHRADEAVRGLRLAPDDRRGRGPRRRAGRRAGHRLRRDPRAAERRARRQPPGAPDLADADRALAEGLDRHPRARRHPGGGHLQVPPGARDAGPHQPRAPAGAGGLAALLRPRGAVRRERRPGPRDRRDVPDRRAAHGRQPARQRRAHARCRCSCPS